MPLLRVAMRLLLCFLKIIVWTLEPFFVSRDFFGLRFGMNTRYS